LVAGQKEEECRVNFGFGEPCVFPYRLNGELFHECTTKFFQNTSAPMCPTRLFDPQTLEAGRQRADWGKCDYHCSLQDFRSTDEIYEKLQTLVADFPDLARMFVIGTTVLNKPIYGIRISKDVYLPRPQLKPMVRIVANIHGNEAVGRELVTHLAHHLLHSYDQDERIRILLDTTDISLLPSLNQDGFTQAKPGSCSGTGRKHGMYNQGNVDLNRDFPDIDDWRRYNDDLSFSVFTGRQPETASVMDWSASNPFVLSADLHDGAVLITYPFDFKDEGEFPGPNLTPDNDIFRQVAAVYVDNHPTMKNTTKCYRRTEGGMINGADWLSRNTKGSTRGSMKDFSYLFTNNIELSMELTCCKFPTRFNIIREWENNKESLISFMEQVHQGIKGVVIGEDGNYVDNADIVVWNPDGSRRIKNVTTFEGEFWRILVPGKRVNTGESTFHIQAFFDDCGPGLSNIRYASFKKKVVVSTRTPLVQENLFLRRVGICGVVEKTSQAVLAEINQLVKDTNDQSRRAEEPEYFYEGDDIVNEVFPDLEDDFEVVEDDFEVVEDDFVVVEADFDVVEDDVPFFTTRATPTLPRSPRLREELDVQ